MRDTTIDSLNIPVVLIDPVIPFTQHPDARVRDAALTVLGSYCSRFSAAYLRQYFNQVSTNSSSDKGIGLLRSCHYLFPVPSVQLVPPLLEGITRSDNPPRVKVTALAALSLYLENVAVCSKTVDMLRPQMDQILMGLVAALQEGLQRGAQPVCEASLTAIGQLAMKV